MSEFMSEQSNRVNYERPELVMKYGKFSRLQKGEQLILSKYRHQFEGKNILDIGVGGGRTAVHLIPLAATYKGIDFSGEMIKLCAQRFAAVPNAVFEKDDARELVTCKSGFFDAVFFSFNGIDCVDLSGRKQILKHVHRVLKPGGYFIFSYHNSGNLKKLYGLQLPKNPFKWRWEIGRMRKLRMLNGPWQNYKGLDFFTLRDGGDDFQVDVMYVNPRFQEEMLIDSHFIVLDRIDAQKGRTLTRESAQKSETPWIYLVCEKKERLGVGTT
ncbi:MAG TPA: class I SAM-dependent methyltransferase [Chitinophagales bacterium]|nr:class I SAM-dependent methyltransferase [Chitinophagales bacterium]